MLTTNVQVIVIAILSKPFKDTLGFNWNISETLHKFVKP